MKDNYDCLPICPLFIRDGIGCVYYRGGACEGPSDLPQDDKTFYPDADYRLRESTPCRGSKEGL